MSETNATYQPKVGIEQDADKVYIREDGYMKFFDQDLTGAQLKYLIWSKAYQTTIINSAGVLSTLNLPSVGVVLFSIADAASNASAWLTSTSAIVGTEMMLLMRGAGVAASIFVSLSGVNLVGLGSGALSSLRLHMSATTISNAYVKLLCTAADTWSIMDKRGDVTEQGGS